MSIKEHEESILRIALARDAVDDMLWAGEGPSETIDLAGDPLDWPLEDRPVIYVAGFYSACPSHGVANAVDAYKALLEVGWIPLVPHVSMLIDMLAPNTPEFWYSYDLALLARCDAMYVCDDIRTRDSTGVDKEITFCCRHDIPVYYDVVAAKDRYSR